MSVFSTMRSWLSPKRSVSASALAFSDPIACYEAIAQELAGLAPPAWVSFEVEATLYENSIDLIVISTDVAGHTASRYSSPRLGEYFFALRDLVSTAHKGFYKTCKFKLLSSGAFNVEFEYA